MMDEKELIDMKEEDNESSDWEISDNLQVVSSTADSIEDLEDSQVEEYSKDESKTDLFESDDEQEIFEHMAAVLEGLLYLTGDDGLTIEAASDTLGMKPEKTEELFDYLQKYYLEDNRGIEIVRFGNTYKFLSKAMIHQYAQKLFQIDMHAKLSNAALETLAIIAYKQPITRVEIEEIRGVGADVMLRKLEARGLIKEDGRSDAPGRPILYSVTEEFMDAFQLLSLDELPELPQYDENKEGNNELFVG